MEAIPQLLSGFGVAGLVAVVLLGGLFLFVQPWWAIFDAARSEKIKDARPLVIIGLVLTWCLGCLVYGVFLAESKWLRRVSIAALLALVPTAILSTTALIAGVSAISAEHRAEAEAKRAVQIAAFAPAEVPSDAVSPVPAIHFVHANGILPQSAALADFTAAGPDPSTATHLDETVRDVAPDVTNERLFALTRHEFGTVAPSTGNFAEIAIDPRFASDFSWPKGIAFVPESGAVVVMTSHVYTRFFSYDPTRADWQQLPAENRGLDLIGLAYSAQHGMLYSLAAPAAGTELATVHRFSPSGAHLGTLALSPPIPIARHDVPPQIAASDGSLVLVVPPLEDEGGAARVFVVDPTNGQVAVATSARSPVANQAD